jgi:hypothetical protein
MDQPLITPYPGVINFSSKRSTSNQQLSEEDKDLIFTHSTPC